MPKKYDINKKSDLKRFERDLKKKTASIIEQNLYSRNYDVECPHCHSKISVPSGFSKCPICYNDINLNLNISWR